MVLRIETTLAPRSVIPLVWSAAFIVSFDASVANEDDSVTTVSKMQCLQFGVVP